ncbi:MAG TPA: flagellar basal body-associated FliL family protein [Syntrophales bacterium]|nr:flagellar basal body-associated FliL family protein [Syntrophales bacterium]
MEEKDSRGPEGTLEEQSGGKVWRSLKWLMRKKFVAASLLAAFLGIAGVFLLIFSTEKDSGTNRGVELTDVRPIHDTIENLNNFLVDLKDERGHYRVLVCDIAIMMNPDKKISGDKSELRKKAYNTLKNRGAHVLTSSSAYSTIKKEIRDEFNGLVGGGIKEVYFTKFVIL